MKYPHYLLVIIACLAIVIPAAAKNDKQKKQKTLPPGLEKKIARGSELPPGWQKKIAKGEVLDTDLFDKAERIPNKPTKNYPNTKNTELLKLEEKILRIEKDTREILEIFAADLGS